MTNGLPGGFLGRIGVAYAPGNSKVVYANIENVNVEGVSVEERRRMLEIGIPLGRGQRVGDVEVYRSDDGGETWKKVSPNGEDIGGGPGYYYQQVRVDPNDENHVYIIGIRVWETKDGGKTWTLVADNQNPNYKSCVQYIPNTNGKEIIAVGKTGISFSNDGGITWKGISKDSYYSIQFVNQQMAWLSGHEKIGKLLLSN